MFALTTLAAILAAVTRAAGNGAEFATAGVASAGFLLACFAVFVVAFLVARLTVTFRVPTGIAMLGMAAVLYLLTMIGSGLPAISNWPLMVFLTVTGYALLATVFPFVAGAAMVVMALVLLVMELIGVSVEGMTNWPLVVFFALAGAILLMIPKRKPEAENPFADGQLPPQILPPREGPQ